MSGCRIFIGRLSPSAREKDVERFFKGYGRIRDIDLKRGFGFVVSPELGQRVLGGGGGAAPQPPPGGAQRVHDGENIRNRLVRSSL